MAATRLYRVAAIIFVLFALGHTYGFLTLRAPSQEGRAVYEDVRAQRRAQRYHQHRPAAYGADRSNGHATMVAQASQDAESLVQIVRQIPVGPGRVRRDRWH